MAKKEITYKEAYSRLQELTELIETGKLDVDELNEKLKEAAGLLKICKDKLFIADEEMKRILEEIK